MGPRNVDWFDIGRADLIETNLVVCGLEGLVALDESG
jgi:hypothetical protein